MVNKEGQTVYKLRKRQKERETRRITESNQQQQQLLHLTNQKTAAICAKLVKKKGIKWRTNDEI